MDASPVFEAGEHVLDPVALPIEHRIIGMLDAMAGMGRDARGDASIGERLSESGGAIGSVGEQEAGGRQLFEDSGSGLVVVGLALAQVQQQRPSLMVADHLQLAGQAAAAASDTSG